LIFHAALHKLQRMSPKHRPSGPGRTAAAAAPSDHRTPPSGRRISLALQGGGAFGAFTWGVLDRLLEQPDLVLDAASGASAGAVNAVLLADGLRRGGSSGARERLDAFWHRLADSARGSFLTGSARAGLALDLSTRLLSPYQLNPFDLNPLKALLGDIVDFDALRADPQLKLAIAATRVSDGGLRIFRETELTLDCVLASTCLPMLHHAVEIDGERYWDGGYAANPPLTQLVAINDTPDILLVRIVPTSGDDHPRSSPGIVRRLHQITFNGPLQHDIDAITALKALSEAEGADSALGRKLSALTIHHLCAEEWVPKLAERSLLDLDRCFLLDLKERGRDAASAWLGDDRAEIQRKGAA
jgi:NTE family protein